MDVTLHLGDCRDIMAGLTDGSVDAIVTDPPYGTEVGRDGYGRRQNYGGVGRAIEGDSDLSSLADMLGIAGRVLKPNSWAAIFCSPKRHAETAALCLALGFPVAGEVIWDKAAPGLGGGIRYQHETILLCKHGKPTGRDSLFSVIRSYVSRENKGAKHPHEKPVDLLQKLIAYCARPGEVVLDPFSGSGSTAVACVMSGRRFVGMEIDPDYLAMAQGRIAVATRPTLFERFESRSLFDAFEGASS